MTEKDTGLGHLNYPEIIAATHRANTEQATPDQETAKQAWNHILEICESLGLNITQEHKILDAGCGVGHLVAHIRSQSLNCIGIDRYPRPVLESLSLDEGLIENMPYPDEHFDLINATMLFDPSAMFYPHQKSIQMCQEIWRVLKPGGLFICTNGDVPEPIQLYFQQATKQSIKRISTALSPETLIAQKPL